MLNGLPRSEKLLQGIQILLRKFAGSEKSEIRNLKSQIDLCSLVYKM